MNAIAPLSRTQVVLQGIGLHSGRSCRAVVRRAPRGQGIVFRRGDLPGIPSIPARADRVSAGRLSTELLGEGGARISTVEHLMAAMLVVGLRDATVLADGPEIPILDGSAVPFVDRLRGLEREEDTLSWDTEDSIRLGRAIRVEDGDSWMLAEPSSAPLSLDVTVEYPGLGRMRGIYQGGEADIASSVMDARTFAYARDLDTIRSRGLAMGGSLENAVVLREDGSALNPEGLRSPDEPLRHKVLDILGDLAMLGRPLQARVTAFRPGHRISNLLARAIAGAAD